MTYQQTLQEGKEVLYEKIGRQLRAYDYCLDSFAAKIRAQTLEDFAEYIRAEGDWVKEDVHDGNYGYFRADEKLLTEALSNLSKN